MLKEEMTIGYTRIVERRDKAVLVDFGEVKPVWLPLYCLSLNEKDYTVTAPSDFIQKKLEETREVLSKKNPRNYERVVLPLVVWENDRSIGIDVIVSKLNGGKKVKKRLFFPKSQIRDGTVARWMIEKKEKEAIREVARKYKCNERDLKVVFFKK